MASLPVRSTFLSLPLRLRASAIIHWSCPLMLLNSSSAHFSKASMVSESTRNIKLFVELFFAILLNIIYKLSGPDYDVCKLPATIRQQNSPTTHPSIHQQLTKKLILSSERSLVIDIGEFDTPKSHLYPHSCILERYYVCSIKQIRPPYCQISHLHD